MGNSLWLAFSPGISDGQELITDVQEREQPSFAQGSRDGYMAALSFHVSSNPTVPFFALCHVPLPDPWAHCPYEALTGIPCLLKKIQVLF